MRETMFKFSEGSLPITTLPQMRRKVCIIFSWDFNICTAQALSYRKEFGWKLSGWANL